jgi:TolB-like protein
LTIGRWGSLLTAIVAVAGATPAAAAPMRVVVVPFESFAGTSGRAEVMPEVIAVLSARGLDVVEGNHVDGFLAAERVRYLDTLTRPQLQRLAATTAADAVLAGTILWLERGVPPQPRVSVALHANLFSSEGDLLWTMSVAMEGRDAENALGLGRIDDARVLARVAAGRLFESMPRRPVRSRSARPVRRGLPRVYRASDFRAQSATIAILPLQDLTPDPGALRMNTVRIVDGLLHQRLSERKSLRVMTAADLRHVTATAGLPGPSQMSSADLKALGAALDSRYLLGGAIFAFTEAGRDGGGSEVEIHLTLIDVEAQRIVWSGIHGRKASELRRLLGRRANTSLPAVADRVVRELIAAFIKE